MYDVDKQSDRTAFIVLKWNGMSRKLRIGRTVLSHAAAALLGHSLWTHRLATARALLIVVDRFAGFLLDQLEWYMTARPGGVKLHIQLCQVLGKAGQLYVMLWAQLMAFIFTVDSLTMYIGILALLIPMLGVGARFFLAASFAVNILCVPAGIPYLIMASIYRSHLCTVHFLWQALRGKRRLPGWYFVWTVLAGDEGQLSNDQSPNQQGVMTDSFNHGSIHLGIASLLFVPCLLTLPTIAWFYGTTCILYLIVLLVAKALKAIVPSPMDDHFSKTTRKPPNSWSSSLARTGVNFVKGKIVWIK